MSTQFYETRYFMTQESQDAVTGRVVREHAEAAKLVAALEAEVDKVQRFYQRLSSALSRIEYIRFDDDPDVPSSMPYSGLIKTDLRFESKDIDGDKLKLLCVNLREAKRRKSDLAEQMKKLGV